MPGPCKDPFHEVTRRDVGWILLVAWVVLIPTLVGIYAVGQWFRPSVGPSWVDGLVQGVLAPPLTVAALAGWRRWIRRHRAAR